MCPLYMKQGMCIPVLFLVLGTFEEVKYFKYYENTGQIIIQILI